VDAREPGPTWNCAASSLAAGQSAKFRLACDGRTLEGFLVHHGGGFSAFVNRCPHAGTPLDWWPNEFFTEDGRHLICATHGAVYLPDTGLCIGGPCPGASLTRLPIAQEGDTLVIACPEEPDGPARRRR
jgi:nitrite reductase/ring-hydroxylating ferredoxin subunit